MPVRWQNWKFHWWVELDRWNAICWRCWVMNKHRIMKSWKIWIHKGLQRPYPEGCWKSEKEWVIEDLKTQMIESKVFTWGVQHQSLVMWVSRTAQSFVASWPAPNVKSSQLLPKPKHLIRLVWSSSMDWKRLQQSLRLHMTQGLCWTSLMWNYITLNASALQSSLNHSFLTSNTLLDMVIESLVDSRSSNSFIDSMFVQTQHSQHMAFHLSSSELINGTSNSSCQQALDLQICFLLGIQNLTFYITLLDQSCTMFGYHWSPATTIHLGYWAASFSGNHRSMNPRAHLCRDIHHSAHFWNSTLFQNFWTCSPVNPRNPPRVTLINAAVYSCASKLEGSDCFQSRSHFLRSLVTPWPLQERSTWVLFLKDY